MRIRCLASKRWRFLVGPCGEGFARSNEGALSSTGSAWVCSVVYTNSVRFQAHQAKKHIKITQRCDESSCQILNMVLDRMDIDIDSDNDSHNDNTPRLEDGSPVQCWSCCLHTPLPTLINIIRVLTVKRVQLRRSLWANRIALSSTRVLTEFN